MPQFPHLQSAGPWGASGSVLNGRISLLKGTGRSAADGSTWEPGVRKSSPMPAKDKASHMHPGLPRWACKGVPYMCPYYPRPGCGTQLPRPVEQTWRLGNRRQVLSSRGAASSRVTSSQLPDPLIIIGCHCGLGDQCLTQLSQIHLVTPSPALSSPSWAKWMCQQNPAWPAKEKGESPGFGVRCCWVPIPARTPKPTRE